MSICTRQSFSEMRDELLVPPPRPGAKTARPKNTAFRLAPDGKTETDKQPGCSISSPETSPNSQDSDIQPHKAKNTSSYKPSGHSRRGVQAARMDANSDHRRPRGLRKRGAPGVVRDRCG